MKTNLLTRLQLLLIVLFGLAAIFGPALIQQTGGAFLLVVVLGIAFGLVTFSIGYLAVVKKVALEYPFQGWSITILKPFLSPRQKRALYKRQAPITGRAAWWIGVTSMALGGALVVALLVAAIYIMV